MRAAKRDNLECKCQPCLPLCQITRIDQPRNLIEEARLQQWLPSPSSGGFFHMAWPKRSLAASEKKESIDEKASLLRPVGWIRLYEWH